VKASYLLALVVVVVAVGLWWSWPAEPGSPEDEVRALVGEAIAAAEARDPARLVVALADDFQGPSGASRQDVKRLIAAQLLHQSDRLVVLNPSLEVGLSSPTAATFSGRFIFARGSAEEPAEASSYLIDATLERRGDRWLITRATWAR